MRLIESHRRFNFLMLHGCSRINGVHLRASCAEHFRSNQTHRKCPVSLVQCIPFTKKLSIFLDNALAHQEFAYKQNGMSTL